MGVYRLRLSVMSTPSPQQIRGTAWTAEAYVLLILFALQRRNPAALLTLFPFASMSLQCRLHVASSTKFQAWSFCHEACQRLRRHRVVRCKQYARARLAGVAVPRPDLRRRTAATFLRRSLRNRFGDVAMGGRGNLTGKFRLRRLGCVDVARPDGATCARPGFEAVLRRPSCVSPVVERVGGPVACGICSEAAPRLRRAPSFAA